MAIGLSVDFLWYPIGNESFVHSFFSSICYNLEKQEWGSRFPFLMNNLYQGKLKYTDVDSAIEELTTIQKELKKFSPNQVVWDIEDLSKQPPWGDKISSEITDLSNYYITCNGEDLFEIMFKALNDSESEKQDIILESL